MRMDCEMNCIDYKFQSLFYVGWSQELDFFAGVPSRNAELDCVPPVLGLGVPNHHCDHHLLQKGGHILE